MNICTWVYEEAGERSFSDRQAPPGAGQEEVWKSAAVYFATSLRHHPLVSHVLFTNARTIPKIKHLDLEAFFKERLRVKIERVDCDFRAPFGFNGMRKKPFYLIDILRRIAVTEREESSAYVIFPPSSVWIRPASIIESQLKRYGLLTLAADDPVRAPLRAVCEDMLGGPLPHSPLLYSKDCFAAALPEIRKVAAETDRVWLASLDRFRRNLPKLQDEGEMLSYVYHKLGYRAHTALPVFRTIRTKLGRGRDAAGEDRFLTVWHLPDETETGIARLYRDMIQGEPAFWQSRPDAFRGYLSRITGVPRRSGLKMARDVRSLVFRKLMTANKPAKEGRFP